MKANKKQIILALLLAVFFIFSFIFDDQILTAVQKIKASLETFFTIILWFEQGFIFYPLVAATTLTILALTKKKAIILYIISAAAVAALTLALKAIIVRPRPEMLTNDSFPSGHASFLFASLPFFENKIKIAWFAAACLLCFARIGIHWPSDLVAGAALGLYLPKLIALCFKKWQMK